MQNPKSDNAISLQFQSVSLSITTLLIVMLVIAQLRRFCSVDAPPHIEQVTPKTFEKFEGSPAKVEVGLTINDFPVFNVPKKEFQIDGIIWFRFDPSLISLATIEKFSFNKGTVDYKSPPITVLDGDIITARYTIKATFRTDLYYGFFPFEDHIINLMLINMEVNPDEVAFESSYGNFIMDEPYISGWDYTDHRITSGYSRIKLGIGHKQKEILYPAVLFSLDFRHHSIRYIITVLLPLLIIFFIDLFSFCFNQRTDHATLVALTTANIAALVAYRFVVENITPVVGYPTVADYFYFLFLTNTFIVFVVNCVGPYLTSFTKKIVSLTLQGIIVSCIFYLLMIWVHN